MNGSTIDWQQVIWILLAFAGIGIVVSSILVAWVVWRVRKINLPPDADPLTALRATPFVVVLLLDILDFSLDFLSAPFAWAILSYLGLKPLRGVTVVEAIIPGTQVIPTMTVAWIVARLTDPSRRGRVR